MRPDGPLIPRRCEWRCRGCSERGYDAITRERLRAQVEALPLQVVNMQAVPGKPDDFQEAVLLADVLALLGGDS